MMVPLLFLDQSGKKHKTLPQGAVGADGTGYLSGSEAPHETLFHVLQQGAEVLE